METVVYMWPDNNRNGNVKGKMDTEELCVLEGGRVGGVRLCKVDLVLGWRKGGGAGQWRYLFVV